MRVTRSVLPLLAFAGERGVRPDALLHAAGLEPAMFAGSDVDLLHTQELTLWTQAAHLTGDPDFGLHFADWLAPRTEEVFDLLAFALRSCATIGDRYRRAAHYLRLVHAGIHLTLEEGPRVARLVHGHHREPGEPPRHPVEGFLALAWLLARREIDEAITPVEVRFRHARPADVTEHRRIFGSPVVFGAHATSWC